MAAHSRARATRSRERRIDEYCPSTRTSDAAISSAATVHTAAKSSGENGQPAQEQPIGSAERLVAPVERSAHACRGAVLRRPGDKASITMKADRGQVMRKTKASSEPDGQADRRRRRFAIGPRCEGLVQTPFQGASQPIPQYNGDVSHRYLIFHLNNKRAPGCNGAERLHAVCCQGELGSISAKEYHDCHRRRR